MADKRTTIMVLEVDLQCHRCYKKVKKVLCKFPQIHDQIYDEKKNTVIIKVVCCSPEKIMKKIRCKGGDCIKSIEILPPPKPPQSKKDDPKPPQQKKEDPKPPEQKKEDPKPPQQKKEDPKPPSSDPLKLPLIPLPCPTSLPIGVCCRPCSEGYSGGPCFHGHGRPRPCYGGYGRPVYDSYGGGWYRGTCYVTRCDYFCEENPAGCVVM